MQAMQYLKYGGPENLAMGDIPDVEPGPQQVKILVKASSVNPIDWKLFSTNLRWLIPVRLPAVPGFDVAGEILAVGQKVKDCNVGQRVYGFLDSRSGGASASYAIADHKCLALIPDKLDFTAAAAIPLAGSTALQALRDKGALRKGHRLLLVGAAGGVGHLALQIAKAMGAHVTAVSSGRHLDFVKSLGADTALDYEQHADFSPGGPYDVILDLVGHRPWRFWKKLLTIGGRYVTTVPSPKLYLTSLFAQNRLKFVMVKPRREDLLVLNSWIESDQLRPTICEVFPLIDLEKAHRQSQAGHGRGKIVIKVN